MKRPLLPGRNVARPDPHTGKLWPPAFLALALHEANLRGEPKLAMPWHGWLIILGTVAGVSAMAWLAL